MIFHGHGTKLRGLIAPSLLLFSITACNEQPSLWPVVGQTYAAHISITSYGIPHIKALDWGGLGYGYGYAYASDNICMLAKEVLTVNGELSSYFGPQDNNLASDFFYKYYNNNEFIQSIFDDSREDIKQVVQGYAAGYNRYLRDAGVEGLPQACRSAPWIKPIDETDLIKIYYKLTLLASSARLIDFILAAQPPGVVPAAVAGITDTTKLVNDKSNQLGSNAYGLGKNVTSSGNGMLLGNPHFPWIGPERFYQVHLEIPGEMNIMGASLAGSPFVNIGFNDQFAWSHTVSTADRFTLYELQTLPGQPTTYIVDGMPKQMTETTVSVQVLESGQLTIRSHTFYASDYGPIIN